MSFKISSTVAGQKAVSNRLEKLRVSDVKVSQSNPAAKAEPRQAEQTVNSGDRLRFELSSLNRKSVDIQSNISFHQTAQESLAKVEASVRELQDSPEDQGSADAALEAFKSVVDEASFEGKPLFDSPETRSSDENLEAVVVSKPPKIGTYSVSIVNGEKAPQNLEFTIKVSETSGKESYEKTITASVSPATGVIEGIELYFEVPNEPPRKIQAEIEVKDSDPNRFQLPSFERDLKKLEANRNNPEKLKATAEQTAKKVESVKAGVEETLKSGTAEFQSLSTAQENLRAAGNDLDSLSTAFNAISEVNDKLSSAEDISSLFGNADLDSSKSLLE